MADRARFEARLYDLVSENRFTIAVFFPLVGAVMLLASAEQFLLPDPLVFHPLLVIFGTAVMRLPLIVGLLPLVGRRAAGAIGLLTLYAYGIEYIGTTTGLPYGVFEYGIDLGPMLLGKVPFGLPIFFLPLVANAYLLCLLLLGDRARAALVRVPAVIATVLLMDLVLDPGAVAIGFWEYDLTATPLAVWPYSSDIAFYGVPLSSGPTSGRVSIRVRSCSMTSSPSCCCGVLSTPSTPSGFRSRWRRCSASDSGTRTDSTCRPRRGSDY